MGWDTVVSLETLLRDEPRHASGFDRPNYLGLEDEVLVAPAVAWAKRCRDKGQPFFLSLFTVTTHAPYTLPARLHLPRGANTAEAYAGAVQYTDGFLRKVNT